MTFKSLFKRVRCPVRNYEITRLRNYAITRFITIQAVSAMYMVGLLFKFTGMSEPIKSPRQLEVYKTALQAALVLSRIARRFPADERGLREQARRVGRAPGAAISEAYRKRTYPLIWKNKISDAQSEAGEAQWWLDVALTEGYCTQKEFD